MAGPIGSYSHDPYVVAAMMTAEAARTRAAATAAFFPSPLPPTTNLHQLPLSPLSLGQLRSVGPCTYG